MAFVRVETTDGPRWVNPATVATFWALDGTQVRVATSAGTFEVKTTPEKFRDLMQVSAAPLPLPLRPVPLGR